MSSAIYRADQAGGFQGLSVDCSCRSHTEGVSMTWPWSKPAVPQNQDRSQSRGVDFAWKVHNAQEGWTARVDAKAALFVATQTAVIVVMFAALRGAEPLGRLSGANHWVAVGGVGISMLAVILAGLAVIPMLNR